METNTEPSASEDQPRRRGRSWIATAAVATGLAVGAAGLAGAATGATGSSATDSSSASTAATAPAATAPGAPAAGAPAAGANGSAPDPSTMKNGPGETVLTGDTAAKVEAAALKAVPGATVIRVETDSSGSAYEAHLKKSDGSTTTVLFDKDFNVASTIDGFGAGPKGQAPPSGAPGAGSSTSSE